MGDRPLVGRVPAGSAEGGRQPSGLDSFTLGALQLVFDTVFFFARLGVDSTSPEDRDGLAGGHFVDVQRYVQAIEITARVRAGVGVGNDLLDELVPGRRPSHVPDRPDGYWLPPRPPTGRASLLRQTLYACVSPSGICTGSVGPRCADRPPTRVPWSDGFNRHDERATALLVGPSQRGWPLLGTKSWAVDEDAVALRALVTEADGYPFFQAYGKVAWMFPPAKQSAATMPGWPAPAHCARK